MTLTCRLSYLGFLSLVIACSDSNGPATAARVSVSPHPSFLLVGDTLRLTASATDGGGKTLTGVTYTWSTNAPGVLSVSSSGLLHGMSSGSAVISVVAAGARDTVEFDVTSSLVQLSQSDALCGVSADGVGYCRGGNGSGEVGDGTTQATPDFVNVAGGHTFLGIYPGVEFTCGLGTDSLGYCWGYGGAGSLGTGDTLSHLAPVAVSGGMHFAQLSSGGQSACGITGAGAAYCWGWSPYGQTGDSLSENTLAPIPVPGGQHFATVSTSLYTSCGVTTSHAGFCWGGNGAGELGVLTDTVFTTPVPLAGGHTFQSLSILDLECGASTDGTAYCWGEGGPYVAPTVVSGGLHFVQVSSTYEHACGITADSAAYCWLWNLVPAAIPGGLKLTTVASGAYHDCAIAADSSAYCWYLHCDTEWDVGCSSPPAPTAFAAGHKFREIAVSNSAVDWACGTEADGTTLCWAVDDPPLATPGTVPGVKLHSIAIGDYGFGSCGIGSDSLGYCWDLGGTDSVVASTPAALPGGLKWSTLQVSYGHLCGVVSGSVYCWNHTTPSPVLVPGSSGSVTVAAGTYTDCAVRTDETVACWGINSGGELGIGFASQWSTKPLAVMGGHAFQSIESAGDHTCGLTTDSAAYCWGAGGVGMLGTGDTLSGPTPRLVNTSLKFGALALGWELSCGLTGDGSAYCWGRGMMAPQAEQAGTHFKSLTAEGYNGMCGLSLTGQPICWDLPAASAPPRRAIARRHR